MFLALALYVAQLKWLSGVSSPHEKNMTGQKHLFLLLITDADYLFTAPLRRPQLSFTNNGLMTPQTYLMTLCRRPDFYRLQTIHTQSKLAVSPATPKVESFLEIAAY